MCQVEQYTLTRSPAAPMFHSSPFTTLKYTWKSLLPTGIGLDRQALNVAVNENAFQAYESLIHTSSSE